VRPRTCSGPFWCWIRNFACEKNPIKRDEIAARQLTGAASCAITILNINAQ
jgi:hypothetical protein